MGASRAWRPAHDSQSHGTQKQVCGDDTRSLAFVPVE